MAIKNKLFKFSTLAMIVTIAVIFCCVAEGNFKNYEETKNIGNQTSAKSKLDVTNVTEDDKVIKNYDDEVSKIVSATPEPTQEATQASILGFEPIPGTEIPGIDYRQYIDYGNFQGVGIVTGHNYVNIRKGPSEDYAVIGKLRPNGGCYIIETIEQGGVQWSKVKSGVVEGYIMTQFLKTGTEALAMVSSVGRLVVTSNCNGLNVRQQPSLDSAVLYQISQDEALDIVSVSEEWVEVRVDMSGDENGTGTAYINKSYVNISFRLYEAFRIATLVVENHASGEDVVIDASSVSELRYNMVAYAQQYIGYNYKYSGTTLTKQKGDGIDCSAFMMNIYNNFGMSIPRNSQSQAGCGTSITREQLRPGDLVFYNRGSRIGHVAMYIGDNMIIHASNSRDGIKCNVMTYMKPVKYVRVIND